MSTTTTTTHAAKFLFQMGIELKRIEVVGDDAEAIESTVRRLSSMHDFVFTSGGIGKEKQGEGVCVCVCIA